MIFGRKARHLRQRAENRSDEPQEPEEAEQPQEPDGRGDYENDGTFIPVEIWNTGKSTVPADALVILGQPLTEGFVKPGQGIEIVSADEKVVASQGCWIGGTYADGSANQVNIVFKTPAAVAPGGRQAFKMRSGAWPDGFGQPWPEDIDRLRVRISTNGGRSWADGTLRDALAGSDPSYEWMNAPVGRMGRFTKRISGTDFRLTWHILWLGQSDWVAWPLISVGDITGGQSYSSGDGANPRIVFDREGGTETLYDSERDSAFDARQVLLCGQMLPIVKANGRPYVRNSVLWSDDLLVVHDMDSIWRTPAFLRFPDRAVAACLAENHTPLRYRPGYEGTIDPDWKNHVDAEQCLLEEATRRRLAAMGTAKQSAAEQTDRVAASCYGSTPAMFLDTNGWPSAIAGIDGAPPAFEGLKARHEYGWVGWGGYTDPTDSYGSDGPWKNVRDASGASSHQRAAVAWGSHVLDGYPHLVDIEHASIVQMLMVAHSYRNNNTFGHVYGYPVFIQSRSRAGFFKALSHALWITPLNHPYRAHVDAILKNYLTYMAHAIPSWDSDVKKMGLLHDYDGDNLLGNRIKPWMLSFVMSTFYTMMVRRQIDIKAGGGKVLLDHIKNWTNLIARFPMENSQDWWPHDGKSWLPNLYQGSPYEPHRLLRKGPRGYDGSEGTPWAGSTDADFGFKSYQVQKQEELASCLDLITRSGSTTGWNVDDISHAMMVTFRNTAFRADDSKTFPGKYYSIPSFTPNHNVSWTDPHRYIKLAIRFKDVEGPTGNIFNPSDVRSWSTDSNGEMLVLNGRGGDGFNLARSDLWGSASAALFKWSNCARLPLGGQFHTSGGHNNYDSILGGIWDWHDGCHHIHAESADRSNANAYAVLLHYEGGPVSVGEFLYGSDSKDFMRVIAATNHSDNADVPSGSQMLTLTRGGYLHDLFSVHTLGDAVIAAIYESSERDVGRINGGTITTARAYGNHGLDHGDPVLYRTWDDIGHELTPLEHDTVYYAIVVSPVSFRLAATRSDALAGTAVDIGANDVGQHRFIPLRKSDRTLHYFDSYNEKTGQLSFYITNFAGTSMGLAAGDLPTDLVSSDGSLSYGRVVSSSPAEDQKVIWVSAYPSWKVMVDIRGAYPCPLWVPYLQRRGDVSRGKLIPANRPIDQCFVQGMSSRHTAAGNHIYDGFLYTHGKMNGGSSYNYMNAINPAGRVEILDPLAGWQVKYSFAHQKDYEDEYNGVATRPDDIHGGEAWLINEGAENAYKITSTNEHHRASKIEGMTSPCDKIGQAFVGSINGKDYTFLLGYTGIKDLMVRQSWPPADQDWSPILSDAPGPGNEDKWGVGITVPVGDGKNLLMIRSGWTTSMETAYVDVSGYAGKVLDGTDAVVAKTVTVGVEAEAVSGFFGDGEIITVDGVDIGGTRYNGVRFCLFPMDINKVAVVRLADGYDGRVAV